MVNYRAKFFSRTFMEKWERLLDRCITESKEKDQKQTTLLQIESLTDSNIPYSGIITVTNLDTVNDVIHMALPVLGLSGSETDYQMWVYSNQRKNSYPLIGYECPYAIQASYHRAALHNHEPGKSTSTLSMEDPVLDILSYGGIQFVLKPRHVAERPRRCGFPTNWLSCWGITRSHNDVPQDAAPALSVPTFLRVSGVEDLMLTLWELIRLIKQKGPKTENIFQIVGDLKSFIALKERFNTGDRGDWGNESPLVLATLLKDCLRAFPNTLFSADLYDQWLNVLDEGNDEEARDIQRLLAHLPRANAAVLRHLFSSLYAISRNASYNQMTTSKLALCITPSLLCVWRSTSTSPALEGELRRKISLVEFMIASYPRIFGDDQKSKKSCMNSKRNFGESSRQVIATAGQSAAGLDAEPDNREPVPDVPQPGVTMNAETKPRHGSMIVSLESDPESGMVTD
ncbi:rho GTPase-activating protein 20-like [Lepus europaeus]|uniref:rho GTPase-activating protein 20-like n=1 Tax=Lepus europaeus TaxID=9983 RepID=UPI002B4888DF|nr:rho GTPase-activating protein 20-like [Lepus europaeus]XP_062054861.1 rho GTPase-activating protein 20-like [Lepus europaeus]